VKPTVYRARFKIGLDGSAYEVTDGAYILVEEHEQHMKEAARLLTLAVARYPLGLTAQQMKDARLWLA
jgi:hypothetical protein